MFTLQTGQLSAVVGRRARHEVCPNAIVHDQRDRGLTASKPSGQRAACGALCVPCANVCDGAFVQLRHTVRRSGIAWSLQHVVGVLQVLAVRHVFEVVRDVVIALPIFVVDHVSRWGWTEKRSRHQLMHTLSRALRVVMKDDASIPAARVGFQHTTVRVLDASERADLIGGCKVNAAPFLSHRFNYITSVASY